MSEQTLQEQLPRLKAGGDALDVTNVMAKWTYGPNPGAAINNVRVPTSPWVLEWTLEEAGARLQITGLGKTLVETTSPGSGQVLVFEYGHFPLHLTSDGRYTVTIKAKTPAPSDAVNISAEWSYGPEPGSARHVFDASGYPWVLEWTLEEAGTLLRISDPGLLGLSKTWVETTTPGTGTIVVFKDGPRFLEFEAAGGYTIIVKTTSTLPLEAVNILTGWTPSPGPDGDRIEVRITQAPWFLEWTTEGAESPIQISVARASSKIYNSEWSHFVSTAQSGSGRVAVWEIGRFVVKFEGESQSTVTIKTN